MAKNFEVNLTPQNEEWIKLIPNPSRNMDTVINKLFDIAINDGLLLEIISQSLTVSDLKKFKVNYNKILTIKNNFLIDLDIEQTKITKEKSKQKQIENNDNQKTESKSSGWDEDTF